MVVNWKAIGTLQQMFLTSVELPLCFAEQAVRSTFGFSSEGDSYMMKSQTGNSWNTIIGRMKNGRFLDFIYDDRKTLVVKLPSFLTFVGDFECKDGQPRTAQGLRRQLRTAEKLLGMGKLREALGAAEELLKHAEEHLERHWSWRIEYLVGAVTTYVMLQLNGYKNEECDGAQAEDGLSFDIRPALGHRSKPFLSANFDRCNLLIPFQLILCKILNYHAGCAAHRSPINVHVRIPASVALKMLERLKKWGFEERQVFEPNHRKQIPKCVRNLIDLYRICRGCRAEIRTTYPMFRITILILKHTGKELIALLTGAAEACDALT